MLAALLLPSLLAGGAAPPADAVTLEAPRVLYRANEASATRAPWIEANGWRILRSPERTFLYRVKGDAAAISAAEAFTYGAKALISADPPGEQAFARMLDFLKAVPHVDLPPVADFGVIDDQTDTTGELLNLLTRSNLLFKLEKSPDPAFAVNVKIGTKEYPLDDAQNPSLLSHRIRAEIGDDHRSLRVYGSEVVVARLLASGNRARVLLLNYSGRPVLGLRVRIKGAYAEAEPRVFGLDRVSLADVLRDGAATEFTVPEIRTFAVIDLRRN